MTLNNIYGKINANLYNEKYCNFMISMKVVQTTLSSVEYELLRKYAESKGLTIKDAIKVFPVPPFPVTVIMKVILTPKNQ